MVLVGERLVIWGERVVEKLGEAASVRMLSIELVPKFCSGCHVLKVKGQKRVRGGGFGLLLSFALTEILMVLGSCTHNSIQF